MQVSESIDIVLSEISNYHDELHYFNQHAERYKKMLEKITEIASPGKIILDIGSHFLHQSMILSNLGYKIIAIDVPYFASLPKIQERAKKYNIELYSIPYFENGFDNKIKKDSIDIILFTEIIEHITFNPVVFWSEIGQVINKNGIIYLSTPNSMRLLNIISSIKNILLLRGIGLDYKSILGSITYGHHWKEYSAYEIKKYFKQVINPSKIEINYYHYRKIFDNKSIKSCLRYVVIKLGRFLKIFSDELEIVITK
jgi:2-polyprenyl-6-hydroxyphenyl methylase/3-demethylubiquinone-9 3-methyltransferase